MFKRFQEIEHPGKREVLGITSSHGWTVLLAIKGRWPWRIRLERWPVAAWVLMEVGYHGAKLTGPLVVDAEGFGIFALDIPNFVAVIGPGDRVRRKYWRIARKIVRKV